MEIQSVFALPKDFEVADIAITEKMLTIFLVSTQRHPCCPLCASQASHIHSRYRRHVADLPCAGQEVRFVLLVRTFFCKKSTCARLIFVERLAPFLEPRARVTTRLFQSVQSIGLATGGMLGARGKLGQICTNFEAKQRKSASIIGIDHSSPGKTAPHLVSSITIL